MNSVFAPWDAILWLARRLCSRSRHTAGDRDAPRLMAFVPQGQNRRAIEALSHEAGWALTIADTLSPILQRADETAPIILFDRHLPPGNWREAIEFFNRRSPRPYVILLSPNSDRNLWEELQRVGGSDILRTPVDRESTLRAVGRGWSLWRSLQQLRIPATR
jgi:CheY-like chemotaxis protein